MRLLVNEGDSLRQLLLVATTDACAIPSDASSVDDFTNSGKRSFFGNTRLLAAGKHQELRGGHAVIG